MEKPPAETGVEHAHEGATYPYPLLMTFAEQDKHLVYNLVRAIHEGFEDFKNADPGSMGWAMERQALSWVVPFHDGSVDYFKSLGLWTDDIDAHNKALIRRQEVLAEAWQELIQLDLTDDEFEPFWRRLRAVRLTDAGFDPVWN